MEGLFPFLTSSELNVQIWNQLTAPKGSATPVSDRLLEMFAREVPELAGEKADFEALFDRFEVLAVLSYADLRVPAKTPLLPLGRFASRLSRSGFDEYQTWFEQAAKRDWPPIAAGLFGGSPARFVELVNGLVKYVRQLGW